MRFKYETYSDMVRRKEKWNKWFAWYPVAENGTIYWLETVERRGEFLFGTVFWHYREVVNGNN